MSLKMMHFVFVSAAILLAVTLAVWCWTQYSAGAGPGFLFGAMGAVAAVGFLMPYAVWVRRKLRGVGLW